MSEHDPNLGEKLKSLGFMSWDTRCKETPDGVYLLWADYWPKDNPRVRYIKENSVGWSHFDNGFIASFGALMLKEDYENMIRYFGPFGE